MWCRTSPRVRAAQVDSAAPASTEISGMSDRAIILFAHGARDPEWAQPFKRIQQRIKAARPDATVELAFLEIMTPSLADAVLSVAQKGHRQVTVAPLFMAQGGHLKQDVPK